MLGTVSTKMLLILNVVAVSLCRVNGSSSYEKMTIHHGFDQRHGVLPPKQIFVSTRIHLKIEINQEREKQVSLVVYIHGTVFI